MKLPRLVWFTIPTVLLVVAAVGLQVGLPIYRQQVAIRLIEKLEGIFELTPRGPDWLRNFVGEDRMEPFDAVTKVFLGQTDVTDADLAYICELKTIEDVGIADTRITDAGLKYLGSLPHLHSLILNETRITDDGIRQLKNLAELESLDLESTGITDNGLKELRSLKRLKWLNLANTQVTDAGVAELERERPDLGVNRVKI